MLLIWRTFVHSIRKFHIHDVIIHVIAFNNFLWNVNFVWKWNPFYEIFVSPKSNGFNGPTGILAIFQPDISDHQRPQNCYLDIIGGCSNNLRKMSRDRHRNGGPFFFFLIFSSSKCVHQAWDNYSQSGDFVQMSWTEWEKCSWSVVAKVKFT